MRYLVRDEDGKPLRVFWTMEEARRFAGQGETIEKLPAPRKPTVQELEDEVGPARW